MWLSGKELLDSFPNTPKEERKKEKQLKVNIEINRDVGECVFVHVPKHV